ncbi:MAG: hypothetical protein IEMM0002_1215 [bacterium]|nr:MAG: hypothetical protein IEMM0002_1215 [bacterium]
MLKRPHILVVDDEANILDSLRGILTDEKYKVFEAENSDDALQILQENRVDLVLLDVWLPGRRDGLQTLREMRRRNISAEVIMISGHGSIDTAVRATKLGAYGFIEKPLELENVLENVVAALNNVRATDKKNENQPSDSGFYGFYKYIGGCEAMIEVKEKMKSAAKSADPVLIRGEMGTGKEFTAGYIHSKSSRDGAPYIKVSCGDLTEKAFDTLFGPPDEKPGLKSSRFSKLSGTVFLEDPQMLDNKMQDRLINLIKTAKKRKGGPALGFIAAVTVSPRKNSKPETRETFAAVFGGNIINLPPLRKRGDDIETLIKFFIEHASEDFGKTDVRVTHKAMERMISYPWPGNVKELKNLVDSMIMACPSTRIETEDIPFGGSLKRRISPSSKGVGAVSRKSGNKKAVINQKTLGQSGVITGVGLHTGIKTGLILSPLPANSGIIFSDISSGRQVIASVDYVESTDYCTTLKFGATYIKTIEHIMATLHMYGLTNVLVKVGEEVPILDGSAAELCELIENAGIQEQHEEVEPVSVDRTYMVGEGDGGDDKKKFLKIEPSDRLVIEYRMDYPPPVGRIRTTFKADGIENFKNEIASARTFGFVSHIKRVEKPGFAEGGKLNNIILMDDGRIINTTLRFEDEFARHKILDILGDIYLLGRPVTGRITANMTGHTENIELLRKIRSSLVKPGNVAAGSA